MAIALVGPAGTFVGPQGGAVGPGGREEPGLTEAVANAPALQSSVAVLTRTSEALTSATNDLRGNQQAGFEPDRKRG